MGLLAKIIQNEAKKFLKIDQAILIVKHLFRESYRTTWIYLSQNHVFGDLEVYEKGKNLSFNIIDKGGTFVEADDYVLSGGVDTTSYFPGSIHEKYWKKSDFLELESIRKIGITYEIIDHYLNYHYIKAGHDSFTPFKDIPPPNFDELPTQEPIGCGNPTIQQTEPTIEKLNAEIARLKADLAKAQERIKQLEAEKQENTISNELTGIEKLNQSAKDRQGMARIIATKLWKDDPSILIGAMADTVYREMINYCMDELPDNTDTLKNWIRPIATSKAQRRGRPSKKSTT